MSGIRNRVINPCRNCPLAHELGVIRSTHQSPAGLAINDWEKAADIKDGAVLDGSYCRGPKRTLDFGIKACRGVVEFED